MAEKPPAFTVTDRRKFTAEGDLREGVAASTAEERESAESASAATAGVGAGSAAEIGSGPTHSAVASSGEPGAAAHGPAKVVTMPVRPGVEPEVVEELPTVEVSGGYEDEFAPDELAGGDVDGDGPQTEGEAFPGAGYAGAADAGDADAGDGGTDPTGNGLPEPSPEQQEAAASAYDRTARELERAIAAQGGAGMQNPGKASFAQVVQSFYLSAIVAMGGATEPGQPPRVDILGARDAIDMLGVLEAKTAGNISPAEGRLLRTALYELRMSFLEITNALAAQAHRIHTPPPGGRK